MVQCGPARFVQFANWRKDRWQRICDLILMTGSENQGATANAWDSLEPFAQLFRSMMPRAANIAVFSNAGALRWASEGTIGPDLAARVDAVLPTASNADSGDGALDLLGGQPAYLFWIRGDDRGLLAIVAVLTRPAPNENRAACVRVRSSAAAPGARVR